MRIGELARLTGTQTETIRFYEREALLPAADRTARNYRIYNSGHAERLSFIRQCRGLDMALGDIRLLLRLKDAPVGKCDEVNALLDEHIGRVARRIDGLRQLEKQLSGLRQRCRAGQEIADCGILSGLTDAARRISHVPIASRASFDKR